MYIILEWKMLNIRSRCKWILQVNDYKYKIQRILLKY